MARRKQVDRLDEGLGARRHAINIETMKVFCHVAREQSFSRGAAASGITQSAATQCVRRIEEHLRAQLIDRRKRPLILTRGGQLCYREFCRIVEIYDALVDQLQAEQREIGGTIDVAAIYSVGLHGLGACMQQFLRSYPRAKVQLEYRRPDEVYDAVESGRAHLGLVSYPQARPGLTVVALRAERMVLACRPDHPLAARGAAPLAAIGGQAMVTFDRDLPIRRDIDRQLRRRDVKVEVAMEFDNIETIKQAVEIGAGISILPEPTVCKEVRMGTLAAVRFTDCNLRRPIGAIYRERMTLTPTLSKFLELLKEMPLDTLDDTAEPKPWDQPESASSADSGTTAKTARRLPPGRREDSP